jgi:hypothetical protein
VESKRVERRVMRRACHFQVRLSVIFDYKLASLLTRANCADNAAEPPIKNARRIAGHFSPINAADSADFHVRKFAGHAGWNVCAANANARGKALFLVPPATALCVCQEPQVLSVRKNTHREPPESDCVTKNPETATAKRVLTDCEQLSDLRAAWQ